MIKTETITIGTRELLRTFSDQGFKIENESGVRYDDAIDPIGHGHIYTETEEAVPEAGIEAENPETLQHAVNIMIGNADDVIDW